MIAPADQVIVFDMETHACVLQTVLNLLVAGTQVFVVTDLSSPANFPDQQIANAWMLSNSATILLSEMLLFD